MPGSKLSTRLPVAGSGVAGAILGPSGPCGAAGAPLPRSRKIHTPEGWRDGTVVVYNGKVAGVVEPGLAPDAERHIDAGDKPVIPGVIDTHVHVRDPGFTQKDDWFSASQAAAAGGVTTMLANGGGPAWQIHLLPQKIEKLPYIGTLSILFAASNLVKVPGFATLGFVTAENMLVGLALVPIAVASNYLGIWAVRRVSTETFYKIAYGLMFLIAIELMRSSVVERKPAVVVRAGGENFLGDKEGRVLARLAQTDDGSLPMVTGVNPQKLMRGDEAVRQAVAEHEVRHRMHPPAYELHLILPRQRMREPAVQRFHRLVMLVPE